jgi:hypothetical protein
MVMRISRLPIPLVLAAAALTSVAVIYVYLTAPPMPIHTDPNFSSPLFAGFTYIWRGAAFEYIISSSNHISVAYRAPYHLIYLQGPLYNITLSSNIYTVYGAGIRPILVIKHMAYSELSGSTVEACFIFKLTDVTPENVTIPGLSMYMPTLFSASDPLSSKEDMAVYHYTSCTNRIRVTNIEVNGTHIRLVTLLSTYTSGEQRYLLSLPSPTTGTTIRVTNSPIRGTYVVNGTTYSIMALPYLHFAITPTHTTTVTIYVN